MKYLSEKGDIFLKIMKIKDIEQFETGEHCFGPVLRVNDVDYKDIDKEDVILMILEILKKDINKENLIRECFKLCLEYLPANLEDSNSNICEQCDNFNHYNLYKINKE